MINTESNILLFHFENIKWQYSVERAKQKKDKEDREENSLAKVLSKSSTQTYSLRDSISSQQAVAQESSLLNKPHRPCLLLRTTRSPSCKRGESQAISVAPKGEGEGVPGLASLWDILANGSLRKNGIHSLDSSVC